MNGGADEELDLPCFEKHVKLLVSAAFAVVSIHSSFKED
jgi:hypothetical protein